MEIPYKELSKDALRAIMEEYITREGTDYGDQEYSLDDKIGQVLRQLESGEAVIDYDADAQTCHLQSRETMNKNLNQNSDND
jgi:uncharacterized protein